MLVSTWKNFVASTLLLSMALTAFQGKNASMAHIIQPPVSQAVILNEIATFHCITEKSSGVEWWINGTYSITPAEGTIHPFLRSRNFTRESTSYNNTVLNSTLTVLGSLENNNTEIMCKLRYSPENGKANLTIAGSPDPPVNFSVTILHYNPTQMKLRWQTSYSPPSHPILYYTLYINSRRIADSIIALSQDLILESNDTKNCNINFTVTASNDVAESEPTLFTTPILKVPKASCFEVEAEISHHDEMTIHIQFPELCPLQQINYTVSLVDVVGRSFIHLLSNTVAYTGSIVENIPLHTVPRGRAYDIVVQLETATGSASSCSSYIFYNGSDSTEPPSSGAQVLLTAVGILSVLLGICFLIVTMIILSFIIFHKIQRGKSAVKREADNPFYECPFYESLEERINSQSQHVQTNIAAPSSKDTASSNTNIYHSIPINIDGTQAGDGQGTDHTTRTSSMNEEKAAGVKNDLEGEEVYTVMHTPIGMSTTPAKEYIHTWMSMPENFRRE